MMPLELKVGGTVKGNDRERSRTRGFRSEAVQRCGRDRDQRRRQRITRFAGHLLKDEEDHVDFLEAQMHQIKEMGYERYLTQQMGENEEWISQRFKGPTSRKVCEKWG